VGIAMDIDVSLITWDIIDSALNRYNSQCYLNASSISVISMW